MEVCVDAVRSRAEAYLLPLDAKSADSLATRGAIKSRIAEFGARNSDLLRLAKVGAIKTVQARISRRDAEDAEARSPELCISEGGGNKNLELGARSWRFWRS